MPKRNIRGSVWIAIVLVGTTIAGLLFLIAPAEQPALRPSEAVEPEGTVMAPATPAPPAEPGSTATTIMPATAQDTPPRRERRGAKPITPEVERVRKRVLESLGGQQGDTAKEVAKDATTRAAEQPPGNMKDRSGELSPETMRVLNHEFMPLVGECYDLAHERDPRLRGMLAVSIQLAGAEELGTIIDALEPVEGLNEIKDPELIECVRQSAFTIQLPMPLKSGRVGRQLTIPFGDPPPDQPGGPAKKDPAGQQ
jgi:hypothetical protein